MRRAFCRFGSWPAACLVWGLWAAVPAWAAPAAPEVEALLAKGQALYHSYDQDPSRLDEAIRCYKDALALDPRNYQILWGLAEMLQSKGQMLGPEQRREKIAIWDEGAEYGKRAVEANPHGKEGHYFYMANFGASAQLQGLLNSIWKFRRIKRALDRTYALDPDWPPVLLAKAQYLTEMPGVFGGSEREAEALYRRAIELDPHCSVARYFLAEFLVRKRRMPEAVEHLKALIECPDPGNPGNWAMVDAPKARRLLQQIRDEAGAAGGE